MGGRNDCAGNLRHHHCSEMCLIRQCVPVHLAVCPQLSGDRTEFHRWVSGGELPGQFECQHKKDCYPSAM